MLISKYSACSLGLRQEILLYHGGHMYIVLLYLPFLNAAAKNRDWEVWDQTLPIKTDAKRALRIKVSLMSFATRLPAPRQQEANIFLGIPFAAKGPIEGHLLALHIYPVSNPAVLGFPNFLPGITLGGNCALPLGSLSLPPPASMCSFSWVLTQSFLTLWGGCLGRSTSSYEFLCLSGQYGITCGHEASSKYPALLNCCSWLWSVADMHHNVPSVPYP